LTEQDREALCDVIDVALEEQGYYLSDGNPDIDYAGEWDEVSQCKAAMWRRTAAVLRKLDIPEQAEHCDSMAQAFEDSGREWLAEQQTKGGE